MKVCVNLTCLDKNKQVDIFRDFENKTVLNKKLNYCDDVHANIMIVAFHGNRFDWNINCLTENEIFWPLLNSRKVSNLHEVFVAYKKSGDKSYSFYQSSINEQEIKGIADTTSKVINIAKNIYNQRQQYIKESREILNIKQIDDTSNICKEILLPTVEFNNLLLLLTL